MTYVTKMYLWRRYSKLRRAPAWESGRLFRNMLFHFAVILQVLPIVIDMILNLGNEVFR